MTFTGKMIGEWWLHQLAIREGKPSDWKRPEGLAWTILMNCITTHKHQMAPTHQKH